MAFDEVAPAVPAVQDILDSIDHAVMALNADLVVVYANSPAAQLVNDLIGEPRPPVGNYIGDLLAEPVAAQVVNGFRRVVAGVLPRYACRLTVGQSDRTVELLCNPIRNSPNGAVLLVEDVTDFVRTLRRLEGLRRITRALARADAPAEAVQAIIAEAPRLTGADLGALYLLDEQDHLRAVGGWGIDTHTLTAIELMDEQSSSLALWAIRNREPVAIPDLATIPGVDAGLAEQANVRAAIAVPLFARGRPRGVLILAFSQPVEPFTPDQIATVEAIGDELAASFERAELLARLEREALTDPLTGLANRRAFEDALRRHHARAQRLRSPYGLLMVDLDGMKAINDRYGHAAGDAALKLVARTLIVATRSADLVARIGGDEFAILLPDADPAGMRQVVERLVSLPPLELTWRGSRLTVSFSVGGACWPDHGGSAREVLQQADTELYRAKHQRRGNGTG